MVSLQAAVAAMALSGVGQTVLLDFCADWCGPCRAMDPTVRALAAKGYPIRKVNVDDHPDLKRQYGVSSIPCFVMLVNGREVDRVIGGTSLSRLERMCLAGRQQPAQWKPRRGDQVAADNRLVAASVRLRIADPKGHSCGSGTIIDARAGEALILTCGHIFRESRGNGKIEIDMFGPASVERIPGRLISYDLERDIGLVAVRAAGPVCAVRVAPLEYKLAPGNSVVSVGCNNGDRPSVRPSRVASLNKFLGPANIQVEGLPVEGRSGGGLFSDDGRIIGVCNAADPTDGEGLYAALASIHAELNKAGLAFICRGEAERVASRSPRAALVSVTPPPMPRKMPRPESPPATGEFPVQPVAVVSPNPPRLGADEQAALEEIRRRLQEGAEVVCVVRPRNNPAAKSEIIMLDKASPAFLAQLAAETEAQHSRQLTSLAVPRKRSVASGSADTASKWAGSTTAWRPRSTKR